MTLTHIHIGHHFYAAGNIGDDLMIAGFLAALRVKGVAPRLTCCTPFDLASQRRRFPEIEWLEYTPAVREACVASCHAWLGLGGSPFQADQSTWFLDHLTDQLATCRRHGKPMYFLGISLNHRRDLDHAPTTHVLDAAEQVWTRDAASAELIAARHGASRVTAGADLSHVYLRGRTPPAVEDGVVGFALNFEDAMQFRDDALRGVLDQLAARGVAARWLLQEVRELPGSEAQICGRLPPEYRARLDVRTPAYASAASMEELLAAWGTAGFIITSRYHGVIVGAWTGARVVAVERNDKVHGIVRQTGCGALPEFTSADAVLRALDVAEAVPRERLEALAVQASDCCDAFLATAVTGRGTKSA
jgi:polysaccharide pyruvyl transferase WcaK-like protein